MSRRADCGTGSGGRRRHSSGRTARAEQRLVAAVVCRHGRRRPSTRAIACGASPTVASYGIIVAAASPAPRDWQPHVPAGPCRGGAVAQRTEGSEGVTGLGLHGNRFARGRHFDLWRSRRDRCGRRAPIVRVRSQVQQTITDRAHLEFARYPIIGRPVHQHESR